MLGSFLQKLKDSTKDIKVYLTKYLTPVNYLEYILKSIFLLRVKTLRLFSYVVLVLNTIVLIIVALLPSRVSILSALLSLGINQIFLNFFINWRKKKKRVFKNIEYKLNTKDLNLKGIEVPDNLKKFIKGGK